MFLGLGESGVAGNTNTKEYQKCFYESKLQDTQGPTLIHDHGHSDTHIDVYTPTHIGLYA